MPKSLRRKRSENDGKRRWMVTIFWQGEDVRNPLTQKYLEARD